MNENPFSDYLSYISDKHGEENWVTVYKQIPFSNGVQDGGMYSALVSPEEVQKAMKQASWDLMSSAGAPGFSTSFENGKEVVTYFVNPDEGYLRLVMYRDFEGRKESYTEILEEFRLFHNLFHDQINSTYLFFDETGDEIEVIKLEKDEIKIRKSYLKSFMAAKQMHLLLYFELTRHFTSNQNFSTNENSDSIIYSVYSGESYSNGYSSFSRILGKKLVLCEPVEKCGVWPFKRKKSYENFTIGGDSDSPVTNTSNPDHLANYFGANPNAPHYLTPVFFKKEVMQKYYASSEYKIGDGRLSRLGGWSLRFDNNSPEHISVFLGDLGQDLPEKEQIYWKSFNLIPDGRKISQTNFQRSFMGVFFEPENPAHKFKYKFKKLQEYWEAKHGWTLFLPLAENDIHFFNSIRSMLTNEQSEFDAQILALSKVTIDSVNIKKLRIFLEISDVESKSIYLLEKLLIKLQIMDIPSYIALIRGIQSVRSTGVAHRKGTEYDKAIAKLDININDYQAEFDQILMNMDEFLEVIISCDLKL